MTAGWLDIENARVWAQRVSYVGELGWELYCANQDAVKLWNALFDAGKRFGITPAGYKAVETLRLEKCYRYWGSDITPNETPYESGQAFAVKLNKGDFVGRAALVKQKAEGVKRKLVPLTLTGEAVIYGGEAVWHTDRVVSRVRSGGYGYTVEKNIALCYLPVEYAQLGTILHVELFGERVPATVSPDPLYDAQGERIKG
jgi:4-methylaminobutanoate oxidase (formaldehyde-forming)